MTTLVLTFIATFFIELLYRRIVLARQYEKEIQRFNINKDFIMNLELDNYKLGSGSIYE
ncbi:hypothetical protein V8G69_15285 [Gaetbulibacter sp. M235]|uniref:hypothetical protein n=1 Tax=Gaetbulibacter sp. M235 TaxID=3126510 RepID=UPI00374E5A6A